MITNHRLAFSSQFGRVGRYSFAIAITMLMMLGSANTAFATASVTTATGGSAVSADTTGGAYTSLTGPIISEGAVGDVGTGTIVLNAPSGFVFDTGGTAATVLVTRIAGSGSSTRNINDLASGSTIAVTRTSSTLSITITASTSNGVRNSLTWQNVRVRPSSGTPLASGNIVKTGTSSIAGITNSVTSFGTLTEVAGTATKLAFSTQPTGATYGSNLSTQPVVKSQDQFSNNSATGLGTSKTVTLTLSSGTGTLSGTVALDIGTGAGNGTVTYSGLNITGVGAVGSGKVLTAAATGLTNGVSNTFTVDQLAAVLIGTRVYDTTATAASGILSVSNKVGTDDVTVASGSGTLASANAGAQAISSFGTLALGGTTAGNYTLTGGSGTVTITKATPTLSVTNSPVIYDGSPHAATVSGSVSGSASSILTGGTATQTNAGTYAVTANFTPTDTTNYNSLTGASAGNFVISQADQTITFNALADKTLADPDFTVSATASSGLTVAFTSQTTGVCTVSTATVHLVSMGTCTIRASQAGNSNYIAAPDADQSFTVTPGVLDHFAISAIGTQTAGTAFDITITAQDVNNNTVTGYSGTVDLTTTAGTIAPIQSGAFSSGVRTESVTVTLAGSNKVITATDHGGTATGTSVTFTVASGAVASFSLNNPGDMYARTRLGYTVSRSDSSGNAVSTGTTTVYLYSSSTSSTKKFYDDSLAGSVITSIDIGSGHSSTNFWYYDETPGTYTITASDATPAPDGGTGITDTTDSVIVNPVAVKFVILPPTSGTVDAPITVTVQAQKSDNSVDTNYQNNVTLSTSGSATGGGVVDIINGIGTKDISNTVVETVSLSLSDSQTTGLDVSSTQSVVFAGGAIAQFTLSHPDTSAAGARAAYTITRKDQYGNISSQATSTIYLYSSSTSANDRFYDASTGGNAITFVQIGSSQTTADVWYYDTVPGSWTITASDSTPTQNGNVGINDAVDSLTVTAGSVAKFILNDPGDMTAGTRLGYTVTRKDAFDNLVTSGATTVYVQSNSAGTAAPVFYDAATNGNAVTSLSIPNAQSSVAFWYSDTNTGTWTVTAYDNASGPDGAAGIADATDTVTVSAAPIVATRYVIVPPTAGTVDAPISVTVQAQDNNGNVDTTIQTGVTLHTSGTATGGGFVSIANGVGTISISDTVAEVVNLSLTDSQNTHLNVSSTQSVTFASGAAAQFSLDNPGDMAAGTRIGYTVSRKDQYGNVVTAGATTAYLYSTSTGVNKKFYDAASGGSAITFVTIPDGSSSVSFWSYDEKAGTWTITASDNATAADGATGIVDASDVVLVQPASLSKFVLNDPGNMTTKTRLGYTVTREDQFSNPVTTGVTLVYLYSSSTATTTAFYSVATGGAPTTFATINDGSSSGSFWYYDETPGTWLVTASDNSSAPDSAAGVQDAVDSVTVSATPIVATRFVILPLTSVQVGTAATVTVEAQDNNGNIDSTNASAVTLLASGSATGAGLVTLTNGVGSVQLHDTVAETITLTLSDSRHTGLDVSSMQDLIFSAAPVVSSGAAQEVLRRAPAPVSGGVLISGYAFPRAQVQILSTTPNGSTVRAQSTASANGVFSVLVKNFEIGIGSYGVVASDTLGRTTQMRVLNVKSSGSRLALSVDAVALSPTLGLAHPIVRQNDSVGFIGLAMPSYAIEAQVDGGAIVKSATADTDGSYKILFSTANLSVGSHTVRVRQIPPSGSGLQSDFSPQKVFVVTLLFTPQTDFNQDGVINVQDWSIFLSRWSSADPAIHMLDDLNGDGKVDVTDLSIFVRTLKK